jgi:hypothetical protein
LPAFWSAGAAADWTAGVVVEDWVAFWSVLVVEDVAFCPAAVLGVEVAAVWSAGFCSVATAFESGAGEAEGWAAIELCAVLLVAGVDVAFCAVVSVLLLVALLDALLGMLLAGAAAADWLAADWSALVVGFAAFALAAGAALSAVVVVADGLAAAAG